ncbi:hypothetical protein CYR40_22125 [Chimaeribacter arupi]|uniref:DUF1641 domain-containing protein n=1 Tax=Nissabacter archeti TaxID=1917880 RepID=A0ABS5JM13_9GAMM|nr:MULTISPECIES: DUF1641 domain-containing protein [Yersiniaceae]MBS0970947.1 DUF1641 domain-containing protein [Nissabacter archeti]MDV5139116.1 DUF1641 domain-containing protein [Chimaeribacter arupi]PLR36685.1 hypothetical protein CYR23_07050 [Chimaeribacter arupi]PLR41954.1 hypothetical protein CYR40_22125 [Chimaeribacter arupi]PLR42617.1 hypothetical protein CYR52_21095 [Chimaeribacter arupi]
MAEPIDHDVTPPKIGLDAFEELHKLVHTLHHHGVLRFANDVVAANNQIAGVLAQGLNKPGTLNAVQNLSVLMMALSSIPPETFYKVVFALKDGLEAVGRPQPEEGSKKEAPGITGVYHLLNDESLWRAVTPLLNGLRAFAAGMEREVDKPISSFSGKESDA